MRIIWSVIAGALILALVSIPLAAAPATPIRFGLFMGLTGPNAFLSEMGRQGVVLALEEINKDGGVLGRTLELTVQDTRSIPAETVNSVRRLVTRDGIKLLIGPSGSGEALTVMPVIQELEAVWVMSLPSSPVITQRIGKSGNPWAFRVQQSDAAMARALIDVAVNRLGDKRIATVVRNDDFGRAGGDEFAKNTLPLGGVTTSSNFFTPGGGYDFSSMLTRLKQENPQAIVFLGTIEDFIPFMKQYAEQGLKARIYTRSVSITDVLYRELGALAHGIHAGEPYFAEITTRENREFVSRFRARWNRDPITHAYTSYAAGRVLAEAVRIAGSDSPARVRESMHRVRFRGVTGDITFDDGNQAYTNIYVGRVNCIPGPCRVEVVASTPSR